MKKKISPTVVRRKWGGWSTRVIVSESSPSSPKYFPSFWIFPVQVTSWACYGVGLFCCFVFLLSPVSCSHSTSTMCFNEEIFTHWTADTQNHFLWFGWNLEHLMPPLGLAPEKHACSLYLCLIALVQSPACSIIPYKAVPYLNIFAVLFWTFYCWLHPFWDETPRTVHLHQDLNVAQ